MKKYLTLLLFILLLSVNSKGQIYNTCAAAAAGTNITNGQCINNASFGGSVNMAGICIGGSNPAMYISFVAGSCSQFTINPDFNLTPTSSSFGYTVLTTGCANALVVTECVGNLVDQQDFTISGISYNGGAQLTPGTEYVLRLYGAVPAGGTIDICYNANTPEESSNECSGALGLGTSSTTYFNGGDCSYNGTSDDTPSNPSLDPAAAQFCAGSLENTQWINFTPIAGSSSFQIIGTNINCTSGACAYQFGIFSGTCGSLVNEGCVAQGNPCASGPDPNSAITQTGGNVLTWSGVTETGFTATISPASGTFTGTEEFYLAMDGNADAQCYYTLQGINVQSLPIELLDFHGVNNKKINNLYWITLTETNNEYFTIERSRNAINWDIIGKVEGAGNSNVELSYHYQDDSFVNGINYYRLKQTDFDGNFTYSKLITINSLINSQLKLLYIIDLLGRRVSENYTGYRFEIYEDGIVVPRSPRIYIGN